jgi:hypothetical protein
MKCRLCQREAEEKGEFCNRHLVAEESLRSSYDKWRNAYAQLSWADYLDKVKQLKGTGRWVKEVIEFEKRKGVD